MKPSRKRIEPEEPKRKTPPPIRYLTSPEEARLGRLLRDGGQACPWCGAPAERVVKAGKSHSLSCWSEHVIEEHRHALP